MPPKTASTGPTCSWPPAVQPKALTQSHHRCTHTHLNFSPHTHTHMIPQYIHLLLNSLAGLLCCTTWVATLSMGTCVQTHTLLHRTHTETQTHAHREVSAEYLCTPMYSSAPGHKYMLMNTDLTQARLSPRAILGQAQGQQGQRLPAPNRPQPLCHRPQLHSPHPSLG